MDEQLRQLGRAARAEAEATTDLDGAWASFGDAASAPVQRRAMTAISPGAGHRGRGSPSLQRSSPSSAAWCFSATRTVRFR